MRAPRSSRAIADNVDFTLGVEPLSIDFLGGHELAFAVRAGFIDPPTFDEFLIAILCISALLVAGLRNVLIHGFLVVNVLRCGAVLGCAAGGSDSGRRR